MYIKNAGVCFVSFVIFSVVTLGKAFGENKSFHPVIITPNDKREMILIPKDSKGGAFYIDKYEVTFGDFANFVKATGYEIVNWNYSGTSEYTYKGSFDDALALEDYIELVDKYKIRELPIVCVSLKDARSYAKWAEKRIPTEEEWMRAAGGMNKYKYAWGKKYTTKTKDMFYDLDLQREKVFQKMSQSPRSKERAFDKSDWGNRAVFGLGTQPLEWTTSLNKDKKDVTEYIIKGALYSPLIHYFEYDMNNKKRTFGQAGFRFNSVGFRCVVDAERIQSK